MFFKSIIKILIFFSFHQLVFAKKEVTELRLMVGLASKASEELDISGTGTGFSVSRDGHIVTASHVTENSDQVRVTLKNGITYVARVIKEEHGLDLAILKIDAKTPEFLSVTGRTSGLGDDVYTIGYPDPLGLGFTQKFTKGSISSLTGLRANSFRYQISVPIQPGNSGGPLVCEENGDVLGIIVSAFVKASDYTPQLVNYALKSGFIRPILDGLEIKTDQKRGQENKKVKRVRVINSTCLITTWVNKETVLTDEKNLTKNSVANKKTDEPKPQLSELEELLVKAEKGDLASQESLAHMFYFGKKVEQDFKEALKWYKVAAQQGSFMSQYNLGCMYFEGIGTKTDYEEAFNWYQISAFQGYSPAQFNLAVAHFNGNGTKKNIIEAINLWKKAALQEDLHSIFNLGVIYSGGIGVKKDIIEAITWFKLGAELGNVQCTSALGALYLLQQEEIKQDFEKAYGYLKKAAEKDFANAQHLLSLMYKNGRFVIKDSEAYFAWALKAAKQGHGLAACGVMSAYLEQGDKTEGAAWFLVVKNLSDQGLFPNVFKSILEVEELTELFRILDLDETKFDMELRKEFAFEKDFREAKSRSEKIIKDIDANQKSYFPVLPGYNGEFDTSMVNFNASSNTNSTKKKTFKINFAITGNSSSAQFTILVNGDTRSTFGTFTGSAVNELEFKEGVYDLRVEMIQRSFLFGEKKKSILHIPMYKPNEDKTLYISY